MNNIPNFKSSNSPTKFVALIGYGISLLLFCVILFFSDGISLFKIDLSYNGFNFFQTVFSFPIKIAVGTTTIIGLLIAYDKFNQDARQFKEQFDLQKSNIHINNYYRHLDEFQRSVENLISDIKDSKLLFFISADESQNRQFQERYSNELCAKVTNHFVSDLFKIWFGHVYDSNLRIREDVLQNVESFYNSFMDRKSSIINLGSIECSNLKPHINELGFNRIFPKGNLDNKLMKLSLIFRLCKHLLEFDNKNVANDSEIYRCIGI